MGTESPLTGRPLSRDARGIEGQDVDNVPSGRWGRLHITEDAASSRGKASIWDVIKSYDDLLVKLYCAGRFRVIPSRFLDELAQFIPSRPTVLDLGCGFGLFTLYFASLFPNNQYVGVDLSAKRIAMAVRSAQKLGLSNVQFICDDVRNISFPEHSFQLILTLDLLHHIPVADGNQLIRIVAERWLSPGGAFVMKDVTTRPRWMLWFTFVLDMLLNPREQFYYRSAETWMDSLRPSGFRQVEKHSLWDILPYPHVLLIGRKS